MKYTLLVLLLPVIGFAQSEQLPPKKANLVIVKGVSFQQVCQQLVDLGYNIEKKDNDLHTVRTEYKEYTKSFNAAYRLNIRVKDSTAYIAGQYCAPWWRPGTNNNQDRLWQDSPAFNTPNRKGEMNPKTMQGYAFGKMNDFAIALNGQIEYKVEAEK